MWNNTVAILPSTSQHKYGFAIGSRSFRKFPPNWIRIEQWHMHNAHHQQWHCTINKQRKSIWKQPHELFIQWVFGLIEIWLKVVRSCQSTKYYQSFTWQPKIRVIRGHIFDGHIFGALILSDNQTPSGCEWVNIFYCQLRIHSEVAFILFLVIFLALISLFA